MRGCVARQRVERIFVVLEAWLLLELIITIW